MQQRLFVFREQPYLFGIVDSDFDAYLPLNQVWISPDSVTPNIWHFELKNGSSRKGCFIHPATLFGFREVQISNSSVLFLKKQENGMETGVLMSDFVMQLSDKKVGLKQFETDLVKSFPQELPKSAFRFVQRFKRNNIFVFDVAGLLNEFSICWPEPESNL